MVMTNTADEYGPVIRKAELPLQNASLNSLMKKFRPGTRGCATRAPPTSKVIFAVDP